MGVAAHLSKKRNTYSRLASNRDKAHACGNSLARSLLNRVHAIISSEAGDPSLLLLEQIYYFPSSTAPIFSSAFKYSTTISSGTGPYSAETASRIQIGRASCRERV